MNRMNHRHQQRRYHEHLRQVPMFRRLDASQLDAVSRVVTDLRFHDGAVLVRQGARAHELMVIVSGTAAVTRNDRHVADLGPGAVMGEIGVLTRGHRTATVTAVGDVEVVHIDDRAFGALLVEIPALAVALLPVLAARAA